MWLVKTKVLNADRARQGLAVLVAASFFLQQMAQAAQPTTVMPTGGAYVAGAGSIKSSGNAVTINQSTLRGIIDWSTFSIGQGGTVTFHNGSGATLNRVIGNQMSSIFGSLLSSGSVYVINPEGVLIGAGAHVNTGGDFVSSTLDLPNTAFMNGGSLTYQGASNNVVVNLGSIFSSGGSVFLIGHDVTNSGSIKAKGTVGLAAGSEVLIKDSTGDQRVFVQGAGGDVTNTGTVAAAQAELRAKGGNIYALAGNNSVIAATGTANIDGKVWLVSDGGSATVSGTVIAKNANGLGGSIETSGQNLAISNATVKTGQGGNWLLDPVDLTIDGPAANTIQNSLLTTNVTVSTSSSGSSGPGTTATGPGDIYVANNIAWSSNNSLTISAYNDVNVNTGVTVSNSGAGNLTLRADNTSSDTGTVNLNGSALLNWSQSTGIISILYNPAAAGGGGGGSGGGPSIARPAGSPHPNFTSASAYGNPTDYSANVLTNSSWTAPANHSVSSQFTAYMLVNNGTDLAAIPNIGNFALGQNLDISATPNFTELGVGSPGFTGIFDGFGHTINGLTMSVNTSPLGLFQYVGSGGIVRNLNFTGVNVTDAIGAQGELGFLAGENAGIIANVTASGNVQNQNGPYRTGGVVGYNTPAGLLYNVQSGIVVNESSAQTPASDSAVGGLAGASDGTIINSTSSGAVTGNGISYIGGLVGANNGAISNSSASGDVSDDGENPYIGGLIGSNAGTLTAVSASGSVTAPGTSGVFAGGLIGNDSATLSNLSASGNVNAGANSHTGGLVGNESAEVDSSNASGNVTVGNGSFAGGLVGFITYPVTSSYATGNVTAGSGSYAGGLTGWSYFTNISASYASGTVSAGDNSFVGGLAGRIDGTVDTSYAYGAVSGGIVSEVGGLVGAANSTISGSSATGYVSAGNNSILGGLVGVTIGAVSNSSATGSVYSTGSVSAGGLIGSTWNSVASSTAGGAVTGAGNSKLGGLIGYTTESVSNSHATGNVDLTTGGGSAGGLIGTADVGSSVSGSTASGQIQGLGNYGSLGGLIGYSAATVTTSSATGNVTGGINTWIGGLVGESHGAVTSSSAGGVITGTTYVEAGGLVGNSFAPISGSSATGAVIAGGSSYVGGLVGGSTASITNSSAAGAVTGAANSYIGGLLGFSNPGAVSGSYATGPVIGGNSSSIGGLIGQATDAVTNSYANGSVTGAINDFIGGLVGYTNAAVSGSYATGNVSSAGASGGLNGTGGLIGWIDSSGSVTNSQASGTVTSTASGGSIGGLVGRLFGTAATSTATGAVTGGAYTYTGGVFGEADSAITGFIDVATVQAGSGSQVGGIAGHASATVANSTASGNISGGDGSFVGGLVGNTNSPVSNSTASGNVSGGFEAYVGGLVGQATTISASSASGAATGGIQSAVGGLAGASTTLSSVSATGSVSTAAGGVAGGLVGFLLGSISNSYATGNVMAADSPNGGGFAAGLVAEANGSTSDSIVNSYATGNVTAGLKDGAGGLAGLGAILINSSYATGQVQSGNFGFAGGLVGLDENGGVTNSHATGNVTVGSASLNNPAVAGGLIGAAGATVSGSQASGAVSGGDYSFVGGLVAYDYAAISNSSATGAVSAGIATTAGGLVGLTRGAISNSYATGNVTVGSGINFTNSSPAPQSYAGGLVGQALGSNATITSSYAMGTVVAGDFSSAGGLAGVAAANVSLTYATGNVTAGVNSTAGGLLGENDSDVNQSHATGNVSGGDGAWSGGLSAQNYGSIETSYATGTVSAGTSATANPICSNDCNTSAGGLVGQSFGPISTSFATGAVSAIGVGAWAGGLEAAANTGANISQSYATGSVNVTGPTSVAGGLVGDTQSAVNNSYATGAVTASGTGSIAGGLVGVLNAGSVDNPGAPSIASSYSIGAVSGAATNGGLVGQNQGTANITSAYWDTTTSGQTISAGGTGLTTSQWLMEGPFAANDSNWDFTNTWVGGYPYPVLKIFPYVVATLAPNGSRTYGQADPGFGIVSATNQNGSNVLTSIQGTLIPVTVSTGTHVGTYNAGGSGQIVPGSQLTYLGTLTIDPLTIILGGLNAGNKVYDGTTAATLSLGGLNIANLVGDDNITLNDSNAAGSFGDKNVGTGKTVNVTGITLSGPDAGNYIISSSYQTTANITPATLTATFTPVNKVYDGTTAASASSVSGLSGVIGGDSVSLQNETLAFGSPNAGVGNVSATGYALSGADAGNYVVTFTQNGSASITPATLYYVGQSGSNRPFGAANPPFSGTITGFVGGDTLASTTSGTPVFTSSATPVSNVGSYSLNGSGLTLTTGNYVLAQAPGNATALTINPITISIGNASQFAGSPSPTFTFSYSGPMTPYLQSVLASLVLVTNAPAIATAGSYQITALIPAALAGDILISPGTLSILSNLNNSTNPATPQSIATLPSVLQNQVSNAPFPLPPLSGPSSGNLLLPPNASGMFQVVITPSPDWNGSTFAGTQGNALSQASFDEKSPDGRTTKNKSTYAAGAH